MNLDDNALGIEWAPGSDEFRFRYQPRKTYSIVTKRSILALSASIFDPMGLLGPIVLKPRVLLQDLWLSKIEWELEVPEGIKNEFIAFTTDLERLHMIKIPRYVMTLPVLNVQLHGFCDASLRAYGGCMYVRVCNEQGNVTVNMLTSKVRVAPVKRKTIPQLELCSAHLLALMYKKIHSLFERNNTEVFLWTDSTVILSWLKRHSSTPPTFVGNRVAEIQEATTNCCWNHVPTALNPSDILSRGCSIIELIESNWWTGPSFLTEDQTEWPKTVLSHKGQTARGLSTQTALLCTVDENSMLTFLNRTSTYTRILHVIVWMYRFYHRVRTHIKHGTYSEFSTRELNNALYLIIWTIQGKYFASEITCIQTNP